MDDLASILLTDEPTAQEKLQALTAHLRRQQAVGQLATLIGGPAKGFGQSLTSGAEQELAQAGQVPMERQRLALQRQQVASGEADAAEKATERGYKNAPGSAMSGAARALLSKWMPGQKVAPGATAAELLGVLPLAEKGYQVDENTRNRALARGQATDARAAAAGARQDASDEKEIDREMAVLQKEWDPSGPRAGERGKNQARVNAAGRIQALAEGPNGQPANLNPQQMTELARQLDTLLSNGGQATEGITKALSAHTATGRVADLLQWWTSEPHGAGQQAFVQQMLETAKREKGVAQKQLGESYVTTLPMVPKLLKSRRDALANALKARGVDPETVDWETGMLKDVGTAATSLLSPEKAKRKAELLAKQAAGTLR